MTFHTAQGQILKKPNENSSFAVVEVHMLHVPLRSRILVKRHVVRHLYQLVPCIWCPEHGTN